MVRGAVVIRDGQRLVVDLPERARGGITRPADSIEGSAYGHQSEEQTILVRPDDAPKSYMRVPRAWVRFPAVRS